MRNLRTRQSLLSSAAKKLKFRHVELSRIKNRIKVALSEAEEIREAARITYDAIHVAESARIENAQAQYDSRVNKGERI